MRKPNCWGCKFVETIPGDAHVKCGHPENGGGLEGLAKHQLGLNKLQVKGNPTGIRGGWFFWPLNFDPIWLETCNGFESKEKGGDAIAQEK